MVTEIPPEITNPCGEMFPITTRPERMKELLSLPQIAPPAPHEHCWSKALLFVKVAFETLRVLSFVSSIFVTESVAARLSIDAPRMESNSRTNMRKEPFIQKPNCKRERRYVCDSNIQRVRPAILTILVQ